MMNHLNHKQQLAFLDTIDFIRDPNKKYHCISGRAGSGKSFLIKAIAKNILKHVSKAVRMDTVVLTATTNKAVAVISEELEDDSIPVSTIYSFMNLKVKQDYKTGETKCIPTVSWKIHHNIILIIDESSMAPKDLLRYIEEGTDNTCKILFVGDENQLAPVKEKVSSIYTKGYTSSYLTESVRNAEQPALMDLCEQAKQTVITGKFTRIKAVPGVIDIVNGPSLKGFLNRNFVNESTNKRILCYTNKRVIGYNNYIRKLRGYTEPFVPGEILINNEAIQNRKLGFRFYANQIFEVLSVQESNKQEMFPDDEFLSLTIKDIITKNVYIVLVFKYFKDFKNKLDHYTSVKDWKTYFNLKEAFPDLRPTSASTTHKAQGSTFDLVIVDLDDIGTCTQESEIARMQYVAVSRPRTRLIIKGSLPERLYQ